jgi:hypothetical protein
MNRSTAPQNSSVTGFLALLALIGLVAILTILLTLAQARARAELTPDTLARQEKSALEQDPFRHFEGSNAEDSSY